VFRQGRVVRLYEKLPSPGRMGISGISLGTDTGLEVPKNLFGFPEDLEERILLTTIAVFLPSFFAAWILGGIVPYAVALTVTALVTGTLYLLPRVLFSIEKNRRVQDTLAFFVHFLTAVEHMNLERAYRGAAEPLESGEYGVGWSKLVTNDLRDVPHVLEFLAREMREYSDHLYYALMTLTNELRKPDPDPGRTLEETMTSLRLVSETDFEVFLSKVGLVSVIFLIVPFTTFLLLPIGASFAGENLDLAYIASGLVSVGAVYLASLYLLCYVPPHLSILTREPGPEAVREVCGKGTRKDTDRKAALAVAAGLLVSSVHPVAALLVGIGLTAYFHRPGCTARYIEEMRKELWEVPVFLQELSFELLRRIPIEVALEQGTTAKRFRSALHRGRVAEEMPEKTFLVVQTTIDRLWHSGTALGRSLKTLRKYISRTQDYRDMVAAKLEDARTNLSFVYWFMPVVVVVSVGVFKFLKGLLVQMAGVTSILGFDLSKTVVAADMNIHLVLGVATLFLVVCFALTSGLMTLCSDMVYARKVESFLPRMGVGLALFGAGGTALLWF